MSLGRRERTKNLLQLCQYLLCLEVAKVEDLTFERMRVIWERWVKDGSFLHGPCTLGSQLLASSRASFLQL